MDLTRCTEKHDERLGKKSDRQSSGARQLGYIFWGCLLLLLLLLMLFWSFYVSLSSERSRACTRWQSFVHLLFYELTRKIRTQQKLYSRPFVLNKWSGSCPGVARSLPDGMQVSACIQQLLRHINVSGEALCNGAVVYRHAVHEGKGRKTWWVEDPGLGHNVCPHTSSVQWKSSLYGHSQRNPLPRATQRSSIWGPRYFIPPHAQVSLRDKHWFGEKQNSCGKPSPGKL